MKKIRYYFNFRSNPTGPKQTASTQQVREIMWKLREFAELNGVPIMFKFLGDTVRTPDGYMIPTITVSSKRAGYGHNVSWFFAVVLREQDAPLFAIRFRGMPFDTTANFDGLDIHDHPALVYFVGGGNPYGI